MTPPAAAAFATARDALAPVDEAARAAAAAHHDSLAKPRGSLGRLETLGMQLAAIAGTTPPPAPAGGGGDVRGPTTGCTPGA